MSEKLSIFDLPTFDDSIIGEEVHTYHPTTNSFNYNDEIEIVINQQDLFLSLHEAYLYIDGQFNITAGECKLKNNAAAHLFESITYELNGKEIDRVRDPGTTTTIKGLLCFGEQDINELLMAGWNPSSNVIQTFNDQSKKFSFRIPLKYLFGVFHDYRRVLYGKHKIRLIRQRNDNNAYHASAAAENQVEGAARRVEGVGNIVINNILLKVKHIQPSDSVRLRLLEKINSDKSVGVWFRQWEFFEMHSLKSTTKDTWNVKTSTNLERPRYVIVAFQTDRKDNKLLDNSKFDHLKIRNIHVWLNSKCYPYENQNLDFERRQYTDAYQSYAEFQKSFYGREISHPISDYNMFHVRPIFVIDCSKQEESIKSSTVDVKLEFEAEENFPPNTKAYCIIIHDRMFEYKPISGIVREIL